MPEGHTIHRLAHDLGRDLAGHALVVTSPQGRFTDADRVDGHRLARTEAVGKHLFLHFAGRHVVHVHLGLFGRFFRRRTPPPPPRATTRMRLEGPRWTWDLVGPTACERLTPKALAALRARLGADPLATEDEAERAWDALHATSRSIGAVLLDQAVISGIGNVYRAELLHVLGLHPDLPASRLDRRTFDALWKQARVWLARGVELKRIVTVDEAKPKRGEATHVYGRRTCRRCAGPVARWNVGGRPMHACPRCQPWRG